jgi:hypothetical protein
MLYFRVRDARRDHEDATTPPPVRRSMEAATSRLGVAAPRHSLSM